MGFTRAGSIPAATRFAVTFWFRRRPAKPMGFKRAGSIPAAPRFAFTFFGVEVGAGGLGLGLLSRWGLSARVRVPLPPASLLIFVGGCGGVWSLLEI